MSNGMSNEDKTVVLAEELTGVLNIIGILNERVENNSERISNLSNMLNLLNEKIDLIASRPQILDKQDDGKEVNNGNPRA